MKVTATSNYGTYAWCTQEDRFVLAISNKPNTDDLRVKQCLMLNIDLHDFASVNPSIDSICVYTTWGGIAQYQKAKPFSRYMRFIIGQSTFPGDKLIVKYEKILPRPPGFDFFKRSPSQTLAEQVITVPDVQIKGDSSCAICLEEVNHTNLYISSCNHKYHMSCIQDYATSAGNIGTLSKLHASISGYSTYITSFRCPTCRSPQK